MYICIWQSQNKLAVDKDNPKEKKKGANFKSKRDKNK